MLQRQHQDRAAAAAAPECFFNHINSYYVRMNVCYIPILFLWCLKKKLLFSCFITFTSGEHLIVLLADCSGNWQRPNGTRAAWKIEVAAVVWSLSLGWAVSMARLSTPFQPSARLRYYFQRNVRIERGR